MALISFIVVLLNLRKCRSNVILPKVVVSALMGFVLHLSQDIIRLITGSRLRYFVEN